MIQETSVYPLVIEEFANWTQSEIVDVPNLKMVIFHS